MEKKFELLKSKMQAVIDLASVNSVLNWDMSTYMPPGGGPARGRQMALIAEIEQERRTDPEIGKLLDELEPWTEGLPYDSFEAGLIRATRRSYERAVKVPPALIGAIYAHQTEAYGAWAKARPENDFKAVEPMLEKMLDLSRKFADCFPGYEHIADPLIDLGDYGMKASSIRQIFAELREALVPLVQAIGEQPEVDNSVLFQHYPVDKQEAFGVEVIKAMGYDFERGRQDLTHHPFTTSFSIGDVRITTRFNENDLGDGFFSTVHESGHGMYELGVNPAYEGTPLASGTSSGVHESQSRLWENIVGRSRGFWEHYLPVAKQYFPEQLEGVTVDEFYKAVNKVRPSLIRVDADEVTYNLHIMIRFDLELAMLEGKLAIKDLPDAWHARYEQDLGVRAPDDTDGVMQDVHWYGGLIGGMFQGYTLGNILGANFYHHALEAHPEILAEIEQGKFGTLHGWLKENIYQYGSLYTAPELIEKVLGGPINIGPYMDYLRTKYGEIYGL